jgi:hypothetical protein
VVAFLGVGPQPARAQEAPPPAERLLDYSPYEQETIDEVLAARHEVLDPWPEGKTVEAIDIVPLDVFERRDLLPTWLNVFHVTSRRSVIRREVLLREGTPYTQALVDDTIRNLRRAPVVPQVSVVLVVPTLATDPGKVRVLVITKDVWSLRLGWNAVATAGGIEQLALQPTESNFLGSHQIVNATFLLEPSAYTLGVGYTAPNLQGSRVALVAGANVMVNRDSGTPEGSYGSLVAGQPFSSGKAEWSWDSVVAWQDAILRRYVNAGLSSFTDASGSIRWEYRSRAFLINYEATRSLGWAVKHDFTGAVGVSRAEYIPSFATLSGVNPTTLADFFRTEVPVSDTRAGPSLQYHTYTTSFVRVTDFDTLALQEDYRLGHDVVLRVYPSFRALESTRDVYGLFAAAQYTWAIRDGVFRVSIQSTTEAEPSRIADASLVPRAHLATPIIGGVGRLVLDGTLLWRPYNYLQQTTTIGGDDRARGYPTNYFVGQNAYAYNVEFRTRPVEILSAEVGGVLFFDVADAANGSIGALRPYQSAGGGIRVLFPWLDREVFRADLGVPLQHPQSVSSTGGGPPPPVNFVITFAQAFDTPSVACSTGSIGPIALRCPVLPTGQATDAP